MISPGGWKERHKADDTVVKRPLSAKTKLEMYVGRRRLQLNHYEATMPREDYAKFYQWVQAWAAARPS